jgi:Icc protein
MKLSCLSLLQVTDIHVLPTFENTLLGVQTERYFHDVLAHAFEKRKNYDLLLLTGDLAQSPCVASYQRILEKIETLQIPVRCLAGNHDNFDLMQHIFNTPQISCQKQTRFDKWQILTLNSQIIGQEKGYLAQTELDFLETCLHENKDLFTLIALHHNCLPTGSAWLDTMTIENSDAFLNMVTRFPNVKVIANGHIHQEMDKKTGGISVLGTPSTCFQFALNNADFKMDRMAPGYRIIDLFDDGTIETCVHRIESDMSELELDSEGY